MSTVIFDGGVVKSNTLAIDENDLYRPKEDCKIKDRKIALGISILNLIISLIVYISYDSSSILFQFVQDNYGGASPAATSFFNIYLGVDGISIYFVVRPLTVLEIASLWAVIELILCKPINLPEVEITRGVQHVNKVPKDVKCKYPRGKVIYIHAQIIMPLQNYNLTSKTLDTKIHSFAGPALFTLQQKMRLYPNIKKSGILQSVKYSTTSGASKDLSNISAKFYENADTQKLEILKENQNKSGIYRWVNKINGKTYIGSSKNLGKRLRDYFNISFLEKKTEKGKSMVYIALLKKGYSNFTLEILEYCDSADLLKREQYYIDRLNPEYNILKTAGSSLGFKHSDEIRAKISNSLAGERNPMFGKTGSQSPRFGKQHSEETRAKISIFKAGKPRPQGAGKSSQPIEVMDIKNNIKTRYDSISAVALALGIKSATLSKYFSIYPKKPFNSQYVFNKVKLSCRRDNLRQSQARMIHTKCNHKCVEKQNACFSSWLLIRERFLKHWAKDIISDFNTGTGDPLSLVMGIRILTCRASIYVGAFKGDGVIIVLLINQKEGSQETVFNKNRTRMGNTIHSIPLRTKTFDYNSMLARHSLVGVRHFCSNKGAGELSRAPALSVQTKKSIDPWFLTGFTDAEGCFMVNVIKGSKLRAGWRVQPVFQIGLHSRDEELLNNIQNYFCGYGFMTKLTKSSIIFRIFSLEQLDKVLEHFEQYPLQSKKHADFCLFKEVIIKMKAGEHLTAKGLLDIIELKASLNNGLTPLLKESFPKCIPVPRPIVENPHIPDPNWLAGFTSGDGCFTINMIKSFAYKTGFSVNLRFQISQHSRDEVLMRRLIDYMGCGQYYSLKGEGKFKGDLVVSRLPDIINKIKPFFSEYPILGVKSKDFQFWCEAVELMSKKEHLKVEGLEKIRQIKESINNHIVSHPRVNISVNCAEDTAKFRRGDVNSKVKGGDMSNQICTTNLIAILSDISVYSEVYSLIKSNWLLHKSISAGEDKEGLYEMSESTLSNPTLIEEGSVRSRKLKEIREGIKNWTYTCKPVHKLYVRKANGKLIPIAIPSLNDIILQTGMKLLIERVCNYKIFNKTGYWFRPSVYDALHSVREMEGVIFLIEGRINNFFDNIDINTLVNIIKDKLKPDRTFMGILHKLIKAGYMEYPNPYPSYRDSLGGRLAPQNSSYHKLGILAPLLLNIYLTSLDEFFDKLKEKYGRALEPRSRIYYVRHGDEWVIGVAGPFKLAKNIKEDIKTYLREEVKLEEVETNIRHLGREYAKFLGHYVRWPLHVGPLSRRVAGVNTLESLPRPPFEVTFSPSILIPLNEVKAKLVEIGFANKLGRPKYMGKFIFLSDYEIVKKYNRVLIKIIGFYNMADNLSGLRELIYILEYSLAHTLAAKHRSTLAKIFNKYGKPIWAIGEDSAKIKFAKPSSFSANYLNKKFYLSRRVLANKEGLSIAHLLSYIFDEDR